MEKNNQLGLGISGTAFWMRDYWDRYIRDADHFDNVRAYIERNPVTAGLCKQSRDWPWSSAASGNASPGSAEPQLGANEEIQAKLGLGVPGGAPGAKPV
ncbi:MAG: hypothetical protein WED15_05975 [Akkermansiaceae bacterium]